MKVLVINSGSSSIKYSLLDMVGRTALVAGNIDRIGEAASGHRYRFLTVAGDWQKAEHDQAAADHQQGLQAIFAVLAATGYLRQTSDLQCIGHRVVHGGERFCQPALIDDEVLQQIEAMIPLAPLHNPANLLGIREAIRQVPGVPQIAVFDTAFHQTLPPHAFRYALPDALYRQFGVRRYGFHGTSHRYVARQAARHLCQPVDAVNLITLHLGNGASMAAIHGGLSVDTTMGMTPLEGLMMGTRCGDLDPALHFYLTRTLNWTNDQLERVLNKSSGCKGICGENDMRTVHALATGGDAHAQLALDMYAYRIKKYIGSYFAVLGRVDALVFTGGIGENDAWLREASCSGLQLFGIAIEPERNRALRGVGAIHRPGQPVQVWVIPTDEELEIALQAMDCLAGAAGSMVGSDC